MNYEINEDHITLDGKKIDKKKFEAFVNLSGARQWHVGTASGIMSWDEYYDDQFLLECDLIAFTKYVGSRNSKKTNTDNPR